MFDWIVMDVINMGLKVPFVPNRMFPKAPLPHIVFAFVVLSDRRTGFRQTAGEASLNQSPAMRIIQVSGR